MNGHEHYPITEAGRRLREAVDALLDRPEAQAGAPRVVRLEQSCPAIDPATWLGAQRQDVKWYWSGRDNGETTAAAGGAWSVVEPVGHGLGPALAEVKDLLAISDDGVRVFGGMRFDGGRTPAMPWEPFGALYFVVPRLEVCSRNGTSRVACNVLLPDDATDPNRAVALRSALELTEHLLPPSPFDTEIVERRDRPDASAWVVGVTMCLDAFAREEAEKVVLARQTDFQLRGPADPLALLKALEEATPHSYHFYFQPRPGVAFVGASPERLYRRRDGRLETEALAGTRPRGANSEDDERLNRDLLTNDKEQREHDYVARSIRTVLGRLCESFREDDVGVMQLGHCQHLLTRFAGTLFDGAGDTELLTRLHPTPAVGGVPRDIAVRRIRELERFDRGWYTGPIGWMARDAAEFAVAIRAALVYEDRVSVYTGAGIVPGSDPDEEWLELENKLSDFRAVLDGAAAASGPVRP